MPPTAFALALEKKISTNHPLYAILKPHFNKKAQSEDQLFGQPTRLDHKTPRKGWIEQKDMHTGLTFADPIHAAWAFAPDPVCEQLSQAITELSDEDFITCVSQKTIHRSRAALDEDFLSTVLLYAPEKAAKPILDRIIQLNEKQRDGLLKKRVDVLNALLPIDKPRQEWLLSLAIGLIEQYTWPLEALETLINVPFPKCLEPTEQTRWLKRLLENNTLASRITPRITQKQSDEWIIAYLCPIVSNASLAKALLTPHVTAKEPMKALVALATLVLHIHTKRDLPSSLNECSKQILNFRLEHQRTLLHEAVKNGLSGTTCALLNNGLKLTALDIHHRTPFDEAMETGNISLLRDWNTHHPRDVDEAMLNHLTHATVRDHQTPLDLTTPSLFTYSQKPIHARLYMLLCLAESVSAQRVSVDALLNTHWFRRAEYHANEALEKVLFLMHCPLETARALLTKGQSTALFKNALYHVMATPERLTTLSPEAQCFWFEVLEKTPADPQKFAQWLFEHAHPLSQFSPQLIAKVQQHVNYDWLSTMGSVRTLSVWIMILEKEPFAWDAKAFENALQTTISGAHTDELMLALQLVQRDEVKDILRQNTALQYHLSTWLPQLKLTRTLVENSYLADVLRQWFCEPQHIHDVQHHKAYEQMVHLPSHDEEKMLQALLDALKKTQASRCKHTSFSALKAHRKHQAFLNHLLPDTESRAYAFPFECLLNAYASTHKRPSPLLETLCLSAYAEIPHEALLKLYSATTTPPDTSTLDDKHTCLQNTAAIRDAIRKLALQPTSFSAIASTLFQHESRAILGLKNLCIDAQLPDLADFLENCLHTDAEQPTPTTTQGSHLISDWLTLRLQQLDRFAINASDMWLCAHIHHGLPIEAQLHAFESALREQPFTCSNHAIGLLIARFLPCLTEKEQPPASLYHFFCAFTHLPIDTWTECLNAIPEEKMQCLFGKAMRLIHSEYSEHQRVGRQWLMVMCQCNGAKHPKTIQYIKTHLGRQDFPDLSHEQNQLITQSILEATNNASLNQNTYDGLWIQRLIGSPRFIAKADAHTIKQLIERYRLLSLTLKQDEYQRLVACHKKHLRFTAPIPTHSEAPDKLKRLLEFRADDAVRALLTQLEEDCLELPKADRTVGEGALKVLYSYYAQQLECVQGGLWHRMGQTIASWLTQGQGDLSKPQNTLFLWIQKALPRDTFEAQELARKLSPMVYNSQHQEIGFISESGHGYCYEHGLPVPMLSTGRFEVNQPFYDKHGNRIAKLRENGRVQRENLFLYNTSALVLESVDKDALAQNPLAVQWLMADCLQEQTIGALYSPFITPDKKEFLQEHLRHHMATSNQPITAANWTQLIQNEQPEHLATLLSSIQQKDNARHYWMALLQEKIPVFNATFETHLQTALTEQDAGIFFAEFLIHAHGSPDFERGFEWFMRYAQQQNISLFAKAHAHIQSQINNATLAPQTYRRIQDAFLTEACARSLWIYGFNTSEEAHDLDSIPTKMVQPFALFFDHITVGEAMVQAHAGTPWRNRLLLLLCAHQKHTFFPGQELRYLRHQRWSHDEVKHYGQFCQRLLNTSSPFKKDVHALLSTLAVRLANFGCVDVFYSEKGFEKTLSACMVNKATLHVDTSLFKDTTHKENKALRNDLRSQKAIIEWDALHRGSFTRLKCNEMPLLQLFMLHYCGPSAPLKKLLDDALKHEAMPLDDLSKLLNTLPQTATQEVLFHALDAHLQMHPEALTESCFVNMAKYFSTPDDKESIAPYLQLIAYVGRNKNYTLIERMAALTAQQVENKAPQLRAKLNKVMTEAQTEAKLSAHRHRWYSKLYRFLTRLFAYSLFWETHRSQHVLYCEEEPNLAIQRQTPLVVQTDALSGRDIDESLKKRAQLLEIQKRLEGITKAPKPQQPSVQEGFFSKNASTPPVTAVEGNLQPLPRKVRSNP